MVLLIPAAVKKLKEQGRQEGRHEANAEWQSWLQRRLNAEANNESFDEPPPSQGKGKGS